ncbi:MAG: DMT family transporter [Pseudomonadota bacterium]
MRPFDNAYLLLTLTTLFWAGNAIAGKLAAGVIPPMTLTTTRWIIAAIILYVFARPLIVEHWATVRARWHHLFLFGAVGFALFNFCLYGALNFTTALNVTIEQSAMPAVIMLAMYLVYREPVTRLQLVGLCLSILGVIVTATQGDPTRIFRLEVNIGDAMMMGGVVAYAAYSVALRARPNLPWQVFMFSVAFAAFAASLPFAVIEMSLGYFPAADWRTLALLFYIVVFPSLLSQIFFLRGVELLGANRAGLFTNLVPVFGAILAVTILGERFEIYHAAGIVMVIGGILLAELSVRLREPA